MSSSESEYEDSEWDAVDGEDELLEEPSKSLFSDFEGKNVSEAIQSDIDLVGFDLRSVCKNLGLEFYSIIKLINFVRTRVSQNQSVVTDEKFDTRDALIEHLKAQSPLTADKLQPSSWEDDSFLKPFLDNDPILHCIDEFEDYSEDEEQVLNDEDKAEVSRLLSQMKAVHKNVKEEAEVDLDAFDECGYA